VKSPFALIIEDQEDIAAIFARVLRDMVHCKVETVQEGSAALQRLATIIPDMVLLDLHLPSISGGDILRRIRADNRLAKTRIILITADLIKAASLQKEVDAVLIKPVSIRQLIEIVNQFYPPQSQK
jgi:CheY-like chemotaxis protein